MEQLRSSRILVLDDNPKEAMTVVQALQRMGLNALFYDGNQKAPFAEKMRGIRVLFVDMVLEEYGADHNDPDGCAAMVVSALERVLEPGDGPLVVICWTGHPEVKDAFEPRFRSIFKNNKIGSVLLATKPAAEDLFTDKTLDHLRDLIRRGLGEHGPLSLLFAWEQRVLAATLLTGDSLMELVARLCAEQKNSCSWGDCAFGICAALALAERGLRLARESDIAAATALHGALNPVLQDRLEHSPPALSSTPVTEKLLEAVNAEVEIRKKNAATYQQSLPSSQQGPEVLQAAGSSLCPTRQEGWRTRLARQVERLAKRTSDWASKDKVRTEPPDETSREAAALLTARSRGALNTMILLSSVVNDGDVSPGNLYLMDSTTNGTKFNQAAPKILWQNIEQDTFFNKERHPASFWPILLEFSAPCDFAQAKVRVPRFVAGYLVEQGILDQVPTQGVFIRVLGPLLLSEAKPKIEGVFWLVLNSRFVISVAAQYARKWSCFARVRSAALADITAWVTSQMARPGYVHLEQ